MAENSHVRDIEEELILRLKQRIIRNGRSSEAEHHESRRQMPACGSDQSFDDLAAELRAMTAGRDQTPSEVLQREGRDER